MELLNHQKLSVDGMTKSIESGKNLFILSDDIGSGKTVTFLSFLKTRKERCIIFTSSNIIHQWKNTIKLILPDIRYEVILKKRTKYNKKIELFLAIKSSFKDLTVAFPTYAVCIDEMETFSQLVLGYPEFKMTNDIHNIPFMCVISANKHINHKWFTEKSIEYMEEKFNGPNFVFDATFTLDLLLDDVTKRIIQHFCPDIDFEEMKKFGAFKDVINYINQKGIHCLTLKLNKLYLAKAMKLRVIKGKLMDDKENLKTHKLVFEEVYKDSISGSLESDEYRKNFRERYSKMADIGWKVRNEQEAIGHALGDLATIRDNIQKNESFVKNKFDVEKIKQQFVQGKIEIYTNSIKVYNKIDDGDIIKFYENNFTHKCKFTEVMSLLNKYTDFESKLKVYDVSGVLNSLKTSILENSDGDVIDSINEDKFNIVVILRMFKETKLNNLKAKDIKTTLDLERIKTFEKDIAEINKTYNEILEEPCKICLNPDETNILIYSCCQFLICENCKKNVKECPYCRNSENDAKFFGEFVNVSDPKKKSERITNYIDKLNEIIKNGKSVLLFCDNLQSKVNRVIDCNILKGNSTCRNEIINEYKNEKIKTLLINSKNDFSGICLENTTDIIFLNDPKDDQEKQIIGRALRLGRTQPNINIHRFEFIE
uniref:RING-type domain-containing protein n=1 Tax=viral metagenome TaxID=1070528 RepID=A0A6C0J7V8_9ZZZZ